MKKILVILFSFISLISHSQVIEFKDDSVRMSNYLKLPRLTHPTYLVGVDVGGLLVEKRTINISDTTLPSLTMTTGNITRVLYLPSSTNWMDLNPTLVDGSGSVAYKFSTTTNYVTAGAKIAGFYNNNVEKVSIGFDGSINIASGAKYKINSLDLSGGDITNTPAGTIAATTAQAAINELDGEKLSMQRVVLTSDVINDNATPNTIEDITGLSFAVASGRTYYFKFVIMFTAQATTTGSLWTINGPATSYLSYISIWGTGVSAGNIVVYAVPTYNTPTTSSSTSASTSGNTATIEGTITPSENGTVICRFASEVGGSAIVAKTGSFVQYQDITP